MGCLSCSLGVLSWILLTLRADPKGHGTDSEYSSEKIKRGKNGNIAQRCQQY